MSEHINDAMGQQLREEAIDLEAFRDKENEAVISYEALLADLRAHGKLKIDC